MENTNTFQFPDDQAVFFLAEGEAYAGPYRPSEIYSMLQTKKISWVDFCYREQEGQWLRIADHPVFKIVQAVPPKPKPQMAPPPPPKLEPEVQWFLFQNDTQTGPYSAGELKRLGSSGQLSQGAFVWQEKYTEWKPYAEVSELRSVSSIPKPSAPAAKMEAAPAPTETKSQE